jgi:preprotein translocase subunit SecD
LASADVPPATDATVLQIRPVLALAPAESGCSAAPVEADTQVTACDADGNVYTLGPAVATAADVTSASADPGAASIVIQLGSEGSAALLAATTHAADAPPPRDQIALVIDGKVLSAPSARSPIADGQLQISGLSSVEAGALVARLSS